MHIYIYTYICIIYVCVSVSVRMLSIDVHSAAKKKVPAIALYRPARTSAEVLYTDRKSVV